MNCFFAEPAFKNDREELILSALKNAVKNSGFKVLYQPVLETRSGRFIAAEALVRLSDDTLKDIMPSEFIPIADPYDFY